MHREKPFDLVFGSGLFPGADTAGRLSRLLGIPSVGLAIGSDANLAPSYSKALARHFVRVVRSLDGLLANGHGVATLLEQASERECRIADGVVDLDIFRPSENRCPLRAELGLAETHDVLLFAGYLTREKGIYELLSAFVRVRQQLPNAVLAICGRGAEEKGLRQRISELGLGDWVRLAGQVPPNQMWKWMQVSDVFVLPSYNEGMPNAVMEAMACGLPVVSTNVGGLPAAVGDSGGAVLVEPRQSETLATVLQSILGDRALRQRMGQAARKTAVQKFGADNNARQLLGYLQQLVIERGVGRPGV